MANIPKPPTQVQLDALNRLVVDCDAGKVYNKLGVEVGNIGSDGYYRVWIKSDVHKSKQRPVRRCHIIFWAFHKRWPEEEIDHDDRNGLNDCIDNLIESDRNKNSANRSRPVHDLPPGVHFKPRMKTNPYSAVKQFEGKVHYIGYYPTPEQAAKAYINYKG